MALNTTRMTSPIKFESEVTKELLELCKPHVWQEQKQQQESGKDNNWQRVEVFANTRPQVMRMKMPQNGGTPKIGSFHYYRERINLRIFANNEFSYAPAHFTARTESLEKPGVVHLGAIAFVVDAALSFHAIHSQQQMCMTRSLEVEYVHDIPLESTVVVRIKTNFVNGRKLECSCEGVLAAAPKPGNTKLEIGQVLFKGKAFFLTVDLPQLTGPVDSNTPFADRARKAVLASEAFDETALAGEINRENSDIFFAEWPKLESVLPFVTSSMPDSASAEEITSWSKCSSSNGCNSKNIPFDFVEDAMTCTTKLRLFSANNEQNNKLLFGLVSFSNQSMGPFVVHGGCVISFYNQFMLAAVNEYFSKDDKNKNNGAPFEVVKIAVDYLKGVPICSVVLVDDFEVTVGNGDPNLVEAKAAIYEIPSSSAQQQQSGEAVLVEKKLLTKCMVTLARKSLPN